MRKIAYWPYVVLAVLLFSMMSFPQRAAESVRSMVVCGLAPCWKGVDLMKGKALFLLTLPFWQNAKIDERHVEEIDRLKQENLTLRTQIENIREWLLHEDRLQEQVERLKLFTAVGQRESQSRDFFQRRSEELCRLLELQALSFPAQVIFREPSCWGSSVWINVGEEENSRIGKSIISKNSPVLSGTSIVGIVEYVGQKQSRVRLVTDARLRLSVRAVRGGEQNRYLMEHLDALLFTFGVRQDLFFSSEERERAIDQLKRVGSMVASQAAESYLAKGELFGCSAPLWRSRGQVLKGIGFNYDFSDREGPGRDLRTGIAYGLSQNRRLVPGSILNVGDLLVTTGFDGVFPAGLRVALVSQVEQLKEGASSYEIQAVSTAGNLDELVHVVVLPPLSLSQ